MGEIMDSHYDAAWRAAGAAADGKRQALKELEPRIQALESRIKQLESEIHARQFRSSKA